MKHLALTAALLSPATATASCFDDAMLVLDMSLSMAGPSYGENGRPKITEAREALDIVAREAEVNRNIGFVTYGPGGPDECKGIKVHFDPIPRAADPILGIANSLQPLGSTPLTEAVNAATYSLPGKGTIVLVTDGEETCDGTPCSLARDLAAEGRHTVHVIGFQVRGAFREWQSVDPNDFFITDAKSRCLADETGGEYLGAETLDQLIEALRKTIGCPLFG